MAGYILRDGEKSVVLRADQIDRLLGRGDGDAALLYLCLLRNDGAIEPQRLMQSLRFSELRLRAAETALQELGLIDRIGGLSDALECLHQMIAERKSSAAAEP